ncbi:sigma-70 family RNA polymerase sigma factor [Pannonibacter sp. Pt2-lr]
MSSYTELSRHLSRRFGRDLDAQDVMQDTYLRLDAIPAGSDIRNPRSYLFRMANNVAADRLRGQRSAVSCAPSEELAAAVDDSASPEQITDYRQRLSRLQEAIGELPPRQKQVLLMHKFDGLTHTQIAAELGITKSAVEKLIMKALAHLRDRMGTLID